MTVGAEQLVKAGTDALRFGDRAKFVAAAEGLIATRAHLALGWRDVSASLLTYGEDILARRAIDLFATQSGHSAAQFERATIYARTGNVGAAGAIVARLPADLPDLASNAYLRGTLALNMGDFDVARNAFLAAAHAQPLSGQIWQALSSTGSMRDFPMIGERIVAAERGMERAPEAERAIYDYALGKTLDDRGYHDRAFAAFARGARTINRIRPYNASADAAEARRAREGWTPTIIEDLTRQIRRPTARPIIVTGMPRSGSTLVEQILASHSTVCGGEELMRFAIAVREIGGSDLASVSAWTRRHSLDETSRLYLHLLTQRFGGTGRVVDKTLQVSRYLGLLAAALPEAPIIWLTRDPLHCAWSCYRTYFLLGLPWSYSLTGIAAHMKLEDELLAYWRNVLGDRLLVVNYEALVTTKEPEINRILQHCGLAVEPQVYTPERTRRAVVTASVVQVRSPINTSALHVAEPYRHHLQPFIDAYGYTA